MRSSKLRSSRNCANGDAPHLSMRISSAAKLLQRCLRFATPLLESTCLARINMLNACFRSQPRELAFGELAGRRHGAPRCIFQAGFAIEMLPKLPVSHRPNRRMPGREIAARTKSCHLVEKSGAHHAIEPLRKLRMKRGPIRRD
jgi:hypothetical protein